MFLSKKTFPIFLAAGLSCLLFLLHIYSASMINGFDNGGRFLPGSISQEYLQQTIDYHHDYSEFARRPITTFFIQSLESGLHVSPGWSFVLVNFFFLFLCGVLVFYLSQLITQNYYYGLLSIVGFYLSFTILFAFFANIYTYDEPIQYFFILVALIGLLKRRYWLWVFSIFFALLARETTILLFPAFFWLWFGQADWDWKIDKEKILLIIKLLFPIVLYLGFIYWFLTSRDLVQASGEYLSQTRFSEWRFNFQDWQYTKESIVNIFLVLAPGLFLSFFVWRSNLLDYKIKFWVKLFLLSVIINTPIAIITARIREARVIALPLVFLWPVFGQLCVHYIESIKSVSWKNIIKKWSTWFDFIILLVDSYLALLFSFYWFIPTGGGGSQNRFQFYFFILLIWFALHWFMSKVKEKRK